MIHVCYGLRDESGKYSKYAGTSIQSVLDNTQEEVTIHVLHDSTLSKENRRKLSMIAYNHDQEIQFYNVEELAPDAIEYIKDQLPRVREYWGTVASFFRTLIPKFLDSDRAIYLDTDILVNLDINELWTVDLEGKPLAAVPEFFTGFPTKGVMNFSPCRKNFVDPHDYFNAGVLLMDLDQIRGGHNLFSKVA